MTLSVFNMLLSYFQVVCHINLCNVVSFFLNKDKLVLLMKQVEGEGLGDEGVSGGEGERG